MSENRQEKLEQILIGLLPANGATVGNGQLSQRWAEAALAAGFPVVEAEFTSVRDALLARSLVVKGKGRGGSTGLAAAAAPGADDFSLQTGDMSADEANDQPTPSRKAKAPAAKPRAASDGDAQVLAYRHADRRKNNPEVGLVSEASDPQQPKQAWAYNPHLDPVLNFDSARAELETLVDDALASGDEAIMRAALAEIKRRGAPYLQWTGKAERTSFEVDTVSLHVHERVDPLSILSAVRKRLQEDKASSKTKAEAKPSLQASLFEAPFEAMPLRDAVDFYRHDKGWANRLVSGDSLQVMNSLLVKEGMAGQVQMVYIDPPYGVRYGSNFQPFVGKREVKDRSDTDLTQEPEMIKAFRDTWELGVHSYLTYLRDRLKLAHKLLTKSGSIFVQISDENLHHVRELCDEVFGVENFLSIISVKKTGGATSETLSMVTDYLVWYCMDKKEVKYNPLYLTKTAGSDGAAEYNRVEEASGRQRRITEEETSGVSALPVGARIFNTDTAVSEGFRENTTGKFEWNSVEYDSTPTRNWKATFPGMLRLAKANRLIRKPGRRIYKRYFDDFQVTHLNNVWFDVRGALDRVYVVQTSDRVIERCILMTSDPGDLILDPTCGSGTTAFVAEKWGRRWITCDTSRVAVTLAKQRLMTASYEYFELAYPHEGLKGGFIYKTVQHVTLKSIANNVDIDAIYERLHPGIEVALVDLNTALKAHPPGLPLLVAEGARKGQKLALGKKGAEPHEWEVPFPADDGGLPVNLGWADALQAPFKAFHAARQKMQAEMDRAIAANADNETLYDQPEKSKTKLRITGPFTVEAVPFPTVLSLEAAEGGAATTPTEDQSYQSSIARSGETSRQQQWRDELLKTGIRGKGGQMLRFAELEVMAGTTCLHATGTLADTGERAVVSFGPEYGALEQRQVEHAIGEAGELFPRPKMIVFCAFTFDPEAAKDIDAMKGITALKAQMNTDLLTDDLKKARSSNQSFWLMGQPDVALTQNADGLWVVEVNGFDYFDTTKGELISGGKTRIAMWSLDTDYDGRSLFPHQVFFPMAGKDEGWMKLKKTIRAELDEGLLGQFHGTVSLPFEAGKNGKAAVKIVDDRGIESLKILPLKGAQQ
jgi:adenine-specific DNA-methyltransferase